MPLVTTELYPFSRAPMFADAPRQYCDYAVITPDGRRLTETKDLICRSASSATTGAIRSASASVSSRPPTVDDFGKIADAAASDRRGGRRV